MRRVCFVPSEPVMPCTMIRLFSSNQMLISAPLLTWLGFRFGAAVLTDVKVASRWIVLGVAVFVLQFGLYVLWQNRSLPSVT